MEKFDVLMIFAIIAISVFSFFYLLLENFVISESFDILSFRGVDDVAFQMYIKDMHASGRLFRLNAYAYGWVFWFPIVIVTYPLHFLSIYFGIDAPLIVVPRIFSLIYTFCSLFVIAKIMKFYSSNISVICAGCAFFLMSPLTGYFSQRFGTVSQTVFFSMLCLYVAISREQYNVKEIIKISFIAGLAIATKLSSILILPFVGIILANRLYWKFSKENLVKIFIFIFVCVATFFVFGQPNIRGILSQIQKNQTSVGNPPGFYENLNIGILSSVFSLPIFIFLYGGVTFLSIKNWKYRSDFFVYALFIVINSIYLCYSIKLSSGYVSLYCVVYIYIVIFGLVSLSFVSKKLVRASIIIVVFVSAYSMWPHIISNDASAVSWNTYYRLPETEQVRLGVLSQEKVRPIIDEILLKNNRIYVFRDYRSPEFASGFRKGNVNVSYYDNAVLTYKAAGIREYDIVSVSKKSVALSSDAEYEKYSATASSDVRREYEEDRDAMHTLVKDGIFLGVKYDRIFENDLIIVFRKHE